MVTLYVRVWIETSLNMVGPAPAQVTLYVRVWIETFNVTYDDMKRAVTLYVRVWIETTGPITKEWAAWCHPLREGVD